MKKDIHPKYRKILFVDTATNVKFVCGSTIPTQLTDTFEGVEYPVYRVPVSSASHPLYTGSQQFLDSEGRVDKFRKRYGATGSKAIIATAASESAGGEGPAAAPKAAAPAPAPAKPAAAKPEAKKAKAAAPKAAAPKAAAPKAAAGKDAKAAPKSAPKKK